MNNVHKFEELRRFSVERGFPKELNAQFYMPVRTRTDGRQYIASNADHALLWEPEWLKSLFGSEMVDTGWWDKELQPVEMEAYKAMMVRMAIVRADKGDVIGFLFKEFTKTKSEPG